VSLTASRIAGSNRHTRRALGAREKARGTGVELAFDLLDGAEFAGVRIDLELRRGTAALLRLETPLDPVAEPAAVSVRPVGPWLPP